MSKIQKFNEYLQFNITPVINLLHMLLEYNKINIDRITYNKLNLKLQQLTSGYLQGTHNREHVKYDILHTLIHGKHIVNSNASTEIADTVADAISGIEVDRTDKKNSFISWLDTHNAVMYKINSNGENNAKYR